MGKLGLPAVKKGNSTAFKHCFVQALEEKRDEPEMDQIVNDWMMCRSQEMMIGRRRHRQKSATIDTKRAMIWPGHYPY